MQKLKNIVVEPKTEVCLQILTYWLKNKYRISMDNYEYPELYCGGLPGSVHIPNNLDISILYAIGMSGLVQYTRHSLTAMGEKFMEEYDPENTFVEISPKRDTDHRFHTMYDREWRWQILFLRPPRLLRVAFRMLTSTVNHAQRESTRTCPRREDDYADLHGSTTVRSPKLVT